MRRPVPLVAALFAAFVTVGPGTKRALNTYELTNAGDKIEFKDLLVTTSNQLGKKKGKPVGYDAGTVIYTSPTTQEIEGVTTFPGYGTVTFGGVMKPMKD